MDVAKDHANTSLNNYLGMIFDHDGNDFEAGKIFGADNPLTGQMGFLYYGGVDPHYSVDRMSTTSGDVLFRCEDGHGRMIQNKGVNYKTVTSSVIAGAFSDGEMLNIKPFLQSELVNYLLGINEDKFTLALQANHYEGGSLSGFGYYDAGELVEVTATPNPSWEFQSWTNTLGMVISYDETYTFTMPEEHMVLHANFKLVTALDEYSAMLAASLYPNPARDQIVLVTKADMQGKPYQVIDRTGRIVMGGIAEATQTQLTIGQLPAGVYVVRFVGVQMVPLRFIKQ